MKGLVRRRRVNSPEPPAFFTEDALNLSWLQDVPAISEVSARAGRTLLFLHPPKTGGTTFGNALKRTEGWARIVMRVPWSLGNPCPCGTGCSKAPRSLNVEAISPFEPGFSLVVSVGHVTYAAVSWLLEQICLNGGKVDDVIMTVRPIRNRLESMFRDYWTQVRIAEEISLGTREEDPHRSLMVRRYAEDSRNYLLPNGSIDGRAWFEAFAQHGTGGPPFFLSNIFTTSEEARQRVDAGELELLRTAEIDSKLVELTGNPPQERGRVSRPIHAEAVHNALISSRDLIDELALRDEAYAWMST